MQLRKMEKRVERIGLELQRAGEMRPGSLNKQLTACGRPGCRCQHPEKPKLKNYKTFKSLTAEWIELALAIAKEKLALAKQRLKNEAANHRV